jgi:type I restriction-modification system DNA methylase subunit
MQTDFKYPQFILDIEQAVSASSTYSKDKSDEHGEVFTPFELINEMIDQIPDKLWSDPNKKYLDPCAGKGNFPIQIVKKLMRALINEFPDENERYKHIMENQLYMVEFQEESADKIRELFQINGVKINLHWGDSLKLTDDCFENLDEKGRYIGSMKPPVVGNKKPASTVSEEAINIFFGSPLPSKKESVV